MYLRTVRAKGAEGVEFEYIRLVEAHWENGRSKQRVIANLGRKDLLAPHLESLIKQQGGVRVDLNWLQEWYRTLDQLLAGKERIEVELFARLRDLFHLRVEMVFYDLTSTYFEGRGPAGLAKFGYSRDGKPRNRQVQVGLVMINGWPIAHHVFDGSLRDSATVEMVLKDLQERFAFGRVIFVGDRGMVTIQNLALLRQRGQGYLVGAT